MKTTLNTLLTIGFIVFVHIYGFAQPAAPKQGEHRQNPYLDKFVGTWEYDNGQHKFRIILTKQKVETAFRLSDDEATIYYEDYIIGWHEYIKNGEIVESSMDKANTVWDKWDDIYKNTTLQGFTTDYQSDILTIYFKDDEDATLEIAQDTPNKATWFLKRDTYKKASAVPFLLSLKKVN